jgi:multidrug efflux pump subunit AcrA (membrane-fusion protein)
VFSRSSGSVVWVRRWRGFREVPVKLGAEGRRDVEVLSGLAEGDRVATSDRVEMVAR